MLTTNICRSLKVWSVLALAVSSGVSPVGALAEPVVEPTNCATFGEGVLENGDFVIGDIAGTATSGLGSWFHELEDGTFFWLSPDTVSCRINGVAIARSNGRVSGAGGVTYTLEVEDYAVGGASTLQTLSASREYSPSAWDDGVLVVTGGEETLIIPATIEVTSGGSGSQWVYVTLDRTIEGDQVTCRYRGNAEGPEDPGDAYELARCTGEDDGTAEVEAGDVVRVSSLTVHVQGGCGSCGSTEVEVDIEVANDVSDFYVLIFEDAAGNPILDRRGFFVSGGITVEDLD